MESEQIPSKEMKVEIPSKSEVVEFHGGQGGLTRQPSMTKNNCLCSPTTHAGSFRCRLHRAPSVQRTISMESESLRDQASAVQASVVDVNKDRMC